MRLGWGWCGVVAVLRCGECRSRTCVAKDGNDRSPSRRLEIVARGGDSDDSDASEDSHVTATTEDSHVTATVVMSATGQ